MGGPRHVELMREGEAFFLAQLATFGDADLAAPSRLPGWSRAHVVSHFARNAGALLNLLSWARTGTVTPMYTSAEQRAGDIDAGAVLPPDVLRAEANDASARLVAAVDDLPAAAWDAEVLTARSRRIPASEVPWMRIRETWVHGVDVGAGAAFEDLPGAVVDELIAEVTGGLIGRDDCPAMVVHDTETDREWLVGPEGSPVVVRGTAPDLLSWLIGRDEGARLEAPTPDGRPPGLPPWL